MSEVERIADQLRRAYDGEAWHGPSLRELLEPVEAATAAARPIPDAHTIWEIVLHLITWEDVARARLEGERTEPTSDEDWPAVLETTEEAWKDTVAALQVVQGRLRDAIGKLEDEDLLRRAVGHSYSNYELLHGVIQHDLYHAGQISLLRKAAAAADGRPAGAGG